ncbi:ABC transporter ATP-binding protein, partial [Candidatus Poribacteria bacterium]
MLAVSVRNLSFRYRGSAAKALDGIDFDQEAGEFVVIMGRSGAGKSTFCRCLNGLIPNFQKGELAGEIRIFGRSIRGMSVRQLARDVGIVFQDFEAQLFSTNVELEVAFGLENFGLPREEMRRRVKEALDLVGLSGFERRTPLTLSGGEKQRLAIASVLAIRPRLLVMDEPTTDLDPRGREELFSTLERLREEGITLLLVEHESEEILNADRVILMDGGRIVEGGPPEELLPRVDLLERHAVRPPQVAELMAKLGYEKPPFRAEEAFEILVRDGWRIDQRKVREVIAREEARRRGYGDVIFELRDLSHTYEGGIRALDGVSLTIREGEFVAVIGQNGSGKTTLVKHLNGLLRPTKGEALFLGRSVEEWRMSDIGRMVGFVFQNPDHQIFAGTVEEEVSFSLRNLGFPEAEIESRVREALRAVELEGYGKASPFLLTKGERQRVALASVLACKPRVIILDEPTTGLDYRQRRGVMELLRRL